MQHFKQRELKEKWQQKVNFTCPGGGPGRGPGGDQGGLTSDHTEIITRSSWDPSRIHRMEVGKMHERDFWIETSAIQVRICTPTEFHMHMFGRERTSPSLQEQGSNIKDIVEYDIILFTGEDRTASKLYSEAHSRSFQRSIGYLRLVSNCTTLGFRSWDMKERRVGRYQTPNSFNPLTLP